MTVLNIIELTETAPWVNFAFCASFIGFAVLVAIGGYMCSKFNPKIEKLGAWLIGIGLVCLISSIVMNALMDEITIPSGEVQYEVMINDSISFTEVVEKYDVIKQRGEIFVLEEKE